MSLVLYSTLGCHLCEEAEKVLEVAGVQAWQTIEISESEILFERYGIVIPVLARSPEYNPPDELHWPFDVSSLKSWLEKNE